MRHLGHHDPERSDAPGQLDIYILSGRGIGGLGAWLQLHRLPVRPGGRPARAAHAGTVTGREVHNAVASVGAFESSDRAHGRIHDAMRATILNNLHSMPTDSPTFERRGWSGDAHVALPTMLYNFDLAAFFKKWLDDFEDNQVDTAQNPGG